MMKFADFFLHLRSEFAWEVNLGLKFRNSEYKSAEEKFYQICSMVIYLLNKTGQNSFLSYFSYNPKAKLRFEIFF
jgi:hypothetical protein